MVESASGGSFFGREIVVPTGKVEHFEKEVLAKSVGELLVSCSFWEFRIIFFGESASLLHGGVHSRDRKKL